MLSGGLFGGIVKVQEFVTIIVGFAVLATELVAFFDALRYREDAYRAAGKLTKNKWLLITGIAAVLGFLTLRSPLGLLSIAAVVAAIVYLVDVRPALRKVLGKSTNEGPYGPW